MSIVWTLKKLVDPVAARQEEQQRKSDRERPGRTDAGDGHTDPGTDYRCRVCGHQAQDPGYCPECLADTMESCPPPSTLGGSEP